MQSSTWLTKRIRWKGGKRPATAEQFLDYDLTLELPPACKTVVHSSISGFSPVIFVLPLARHDWAGRWLASETYLRRHAKLGFAMRKSSPLLLLPFLFAIPQHPPRPEVPANLAAPASEEVVLQAHATGSQIYVCQDGPDQKLAWVLKAPDATLFDSHGATIGKHYAGPTWKHNDGSEVVGKVVARQDSPDAGAVPWLLLVAANHSGSGILANVTSIQRIHTKGGQPPASGCDDAHRGSENRSAYSADYYFYAPTH
jgi:Protein of unknown function (DUF3455)